MIGVVASIIPAVRVSNVSPKDTFTLGDSKKYIFMTFSPLVFFTLMGVAGLLLFFPTYNGIPLASYISVALILFAFIGAIPRISSIFLKLVN